MQSYEIYRTKTLWTAAILLFGSGFMSCIGYVGMTKRAGSAAARPEGEAARSL